MALQLPPWDLTKALFLMPLETLWTYSNKLSGPIPLQLGNLFDLSKILWCPTVASSVLSTDSLIYVVLKQGVSWHSITSTRGSSLIFGSIFCFWVSTIDNQHVCALFIDDSTIITNHALTGRLDLSGNFLGGTLPSTLMESPSLGMNNKSIGPRVLWGDSSSSPLSFRHVAVSLSLPDNQIGGSLILTSTSLPFIGAWLFCAAWRGLPQFDAQA